MDYTNDIQRAIAYIEKNLMANITAEKIAKQSGLSEFHFQRIFKKQLGMGVYKYVQQRRITQASFLLLNTDLRIIDKYEITLDTTFFHSGKQSVKIDRANGLYTDDFATIMQQVRAENYRNQRIRLSAYLKSNMLEGWGGIWFRIDGKQAEQLKFDNMQNRAITGTEDWNYYSSVLDVPEEAEVLNFGFLLQGTGTLWADDFCLEAVPEDIQTTDFDSSYYPAEPQNLSFSE